MRQNLILERLGIGVAKMAVSQDNSKAIDVTFYGGLQEGGPKSGVQQRKYRSETDISFPGEFHLEHTDLDISIIRSSPYSFAISIFRDHQLAAQGLGLTDRDDPGAIMVAWWNGSTAPYGVVKYSIRTHQTIVGYYISKMTPNEPGDDTAVGDTGHGFIGDYVLNSKEVSGRTWGPHAWTLSSRDGVTDLAWEEDGRIFCRGIGMPDPDDSSSIIATYIAL